MECVYSYCATSIFIPRPWLRQMNHPFCKGLTKAAFFNGGKFIIGDGRTTQFWVDIWLEDTPLALEYPVLYNIAQRKDAYMSIILGSVPLNIQFRRALVGNKWVAWLSLVRGLIEVTLSNEPDSFRRSLAPSSVFAVRSMYKDLINTGPVTRSLHIWKTKVPL